MDLGWHLSCRISLSLSLSVVIYMARSMCQTLIRIPQPALSANKSLSRSATRLVSFRAQSSRSSKSRRVDPNSVDSESEQREVLSVKKIEDAIHRIIVKRSTPDWLPFVPGSSYWVPPRRRSYGVAKLMEKLANTLTEEEVMSLAISRGWPSSAFFVNDASPDSAEAEAASTSASLSEDEDNFHS
ncbi:Nuclear-interacting partner of ALK like [Actinidia chinensis var. chinensis]|uniref:Nuclear-interacting partner of ALK like n=1 Tax=Actinidia chinensis var. chinensis TaxID=1590841 RepID=A0A2R6PTA8_ACTCC|nr:Nuclear-interacting partner of ALK like [Actinidia chinensis var. chinensis]